MRVLIWLTGILSLAWGGYWVAGSTALDRSLEAWFAAPQGLIATREAVSVSGFPNRFDLTVTAPDITDPVSGWGWSAPFVQVFAMTWKPWHLIAALPSGQVIRTPWGDVTIVSDRLAGSVVLHPGADLALDRAVMEASAVTARSTAGWTLEFDSAVLSSAQDPSRRFTHRIGVQIANLTPDPGWIAELPDLPPVVDAVHLDAHLLLTAALDRTAAALVPQLTGIELDSLQVTWGELRIDATGSVAAASEGVAQGVITLRVRNWRQLPGVLVALRVIKPEIAPATLRMFEVLVAAGPDPALLEAPLNFASGRVSLGPFPIGLAPVIAYRQ